MDEQNPQNPSPPTSEPEYNTPYSVDILQLQSVEDVTRYRNKVSLLPGPVLTVFRDFSTAVFIEEQIAREYVLNKEQKRGITRVIRDVLLGELFMGDIAKTLETQYNIPFESAQGISRLILYRLFTPIIEEVRRMQRERFAGRLTPDTPGGLPAQDMTPPPRQTIAPQNLGGQTPKSPVQTEPISPPQSVQSAPPPTQTPQSAPPGEPPKPRQDFASQNQGGQAPQEFKNLANVIDLRNM